MPEVLRQRVGEQLLLAYNELLNAEARLGEALSPRGIHVGKSVADQWPTLHDYLRLYAHELSPAGVVVFAGRPDEGSRETGIAFTGAAEARERLGLQATGARRSPSGDAFWSAVERARTLCNDAPLEALFGTMHLAHAKPFDYDSTPEVRKASVAHVLRLLREARPQAAVAVGAEPLTLLGHALGNPDLLALATAPEETWLRRWPPETPLLRQPRAEVSGARPFRLHVVPVPSLAGEHSAEAGRTLEHLFAYLLA